jgi:hypothetical protein
MVVVVATLAAAGAAQARAPVIAYQDGSRHLQLYDSQTGAPVSAPALTFRQFVQIPFAVSFDGRYVAYVADGSGYAIHLFDRVRNAEIPLPGIDIYTTSASHPSNLSVSDTGLIAFDDDGNSGVVVYDSATGSFIATGLPPDSDNPNGEHPRQPVLSGDGKFLATTCITGATSTCPDPNLNNGHATLFLQSLATGTDTGLPVIDPNAGSGGTDEEHPCLDETGDLVGADAGDPNPAHNDVYLYDRTHATILDIPNLNDPPNSTVRCSLSFGGRYVGLEDNNGAVRLYDRNTGTQITVSSSVTGPPIWFSAPFLAPNAPAIASPASGATFVKGQSVKASYSCSDFDGGMGIAACTGPVPNNAPLDTSKLGSHSFTVTATSVNGLTSATTATYTVVAAGSGAPAVGHARTSHRRWREHRRGGNANAPLGTTFSFTLNEPAAVRFSFFLVLAGRRQGTSACSPRRPQGRRCRVRRLEGTLRFTGHAGRNSLPFAGRLSRSRTLKPGNYRLTITAVDKTGHRSAPQTLSFTIVR